MRFGLAALVAGLIGIPQTSLAQTTALAADTSRVLVDINLAGPASSVAHARDFTSLALLFGELASTQALYPKPSRTNASPVVDLGGAFMLTRSVGIGLSYGRTAYADVVGLSATIPHPAFLGASAKGTGATGGALKREEAATNLSLEVVPVRTNRTQVRVFGGPSFFSYKADMVQTVLYAQAYDPSSSQNTVTITGFTNEDARAHSFGFHIGADFTYFFTKLVGVGVNVRFSRGTVAIDKEPLSNTGQEIRVGSTLAFLGARFRFGG